MEITTPDGIHLCTSTAHEVATFTDGLPRTNPRHVFEVLYRQGQIWFLRRRRRGEESLIQFMPLEAQGWLREKNFIGALAQHFGERVQRQPVNVL